MAVVTGHTCNGTGYSGSRPKEERQRDCPACQRQALAAEGLSPAVQRATPRFESQLAANKQLTIDVSNLRFYASIFREKKWETDVICWNVFEATLNEIADRLARKAESGGAR